MKIVNQDIYDEWVRNNQDEYGSGIIRYAINWADIMESKISNGEELENIAEQSSFDADTEGITGFMYGAAVFVLATCWEHGEELRRWHNVVTQIGTEGEEANKNGGVLNPALLSYCRKGEV